jgi:Arc/MetJ-type ribon-helix-helix transcriptional regulator
VKTLPELTDEIAEKVSYGQYKTADEYRESIRQMLQDDYDNTAKNERFSAIMNELVLLYEPKDFPQDYIDVYVKNALSQMSSEAKSYGMTLDEYVKAFGAEMDQIKEYYSEYAKSLLTQDMILGSIADREDISISERRELHAPRPHEYLINSMDLAALSPHAQLLMRPMVTPQLALALRTGRTPVGSLGYLYLRLHGHRKEKQER